MAAVRGGDGGDEREKERKPRRPRSAPPPAHAPSRRAPRVLGADVTAARRPPPLELEGPAPSPRLRPDGGGEARAEQPRAGWGYVKRRGRQGEARRGVEPA